MDDFTDVQKVKAYVKEVLIRNEEQRRLRLLGEARASLAAVIPYDPDRRKTQDERRQRKKRREKAVAVRKRKEENEKVKKSYNLNKDK